MNKSVAHSILLLIDLAAIYACYYVYAEYKDISQQVINLIDSITIQKPTGLYIVLIAVPVIHAIGFFKVPKRLHYMANSFLVIFFLALVAAGFYIDSEIERKITQSGYTLCENKTKQMRISEFRTYLRDIQKCTD